MTSYRNQFKTCEAREDDAPMCGCQTSHLGPSNADGRLTVTEVPTRLEDRLAIQDLTTLYGMAVDRRDWTLYRSVFTKDAIIDYSDAGGFAADIDAILEW